jgi:RHS repeat-associated protein
MVTDPTGGVTKYTYDEAGRLTRTVRPNGIVEVRTYDAVGRVLMLEDQDAVGTLLARFNYTRTAAGDPLTVTALDGGIVRYTYDADNRLTAESTTDPAGVTRTVRYTYDPDGNRLTRTDSAGGNTSYTYDVDDRMLAATGAELLEYTYDATGNTLTAKGIGRAVEFTWDAEGRLMTSAVTDASGTHTTGYGYDADGMRVRTTADGVEIRHLLDTTGSYAQVATDYNPDGTVRASYSYGLDRLSRTAGGATTYYLEDDHSGVRAVTDAAGAVLGRTTYDAFGVPEGPGLPGLFGYRGEATDPLTGIQYLRARYYDPATGRFISPDLFPGATAVPASRHAYMYGHANPVRNNDPSGLFIPTLPAIIAALPFVGGAALGALTLNLVGGGLSVLSPFRTIIWEGRHNEFGIGALGIEGDLGFLALQSKPTDTGGGKYQKGNGRWLLLGAGIKAELLALQATFGTTEMQSPGLIGLSAFAFGGVWGMIGGNAFIVFNGGAIGRLYAGFGQSTAPIFSVNTNAGFALPAGGLSGGISIPFPPWVTVRDAQPPR